MALFCDHLRGIVFHPVVDVNIELLWAGVVRRQFIVSRMWNIVNLVIFIMGQDCVMTGHEFNRVQYLIQFVHSESPFERFCMQAICKRLEV